MIRHGTAPWAHRWSGGPLNYKQIFNMSFGYTQTHKKVAAGSASAILAATNGRSTEQVVVDGITQPDVPRALSVTPTANSTGSPLSVVVRGRNSEGKLLAESFVIAANSTTIVNGNFAFDEIISVTIPGNTTGLTITVGTTNKLGVKHRLFNQNTTVKVFTATAVYGALTMQSQPTVVASEAELERNLVTPASAPDGAKIFILAYAFDNWQGDGSSVNDQPEYSTTTSTSSTSSSTSTTTITTSTSSTSVSTSSTSSSTSSTSSSTSSTSTSTTTAP